MKLKVNFENNHHILIELFENSTMEKWFNHFFKANNKCSYKFNDGNIYIENKAKFNMQTDERSQGWSTIKNAISKIKEMGFDVPIEVPDNFNYNQQLLNELHRYYTSNAVWSEKQNKKYFDLISEINLGVHVLEQYTDIQVNKTFTENVSPAFYHLQLNEEPKTHWLDFSNEDQKLNYTYFDYDYDYIVKLDRSILGKCVLQSFEEHDDPREKDCSGRLGSFGGFWIELDKKTKKIYESQKFIEWCLEYKSDYKKLPLEFPIGYVSFFTDNLFTFYNKKFLNIDFLK